MTTDDGTTSVVTVEEFFGCDLPRRPPRLPRPARPPPSPAGSASAAGPVRAFSFLDVPGNGDPGRRRGGDDDDRDDGASAPPPPSPSPSSRRFRTSTDIERPLARPRRMLDYDGEDLDWADALVLHHERCVLPALRRLEEVPPPPPSPTTDDGEEDADDERSAIPKTVHFIWLGSDPLPPYPRLRPPSSRDEHGRRGADDDVARGGSFRPSSSGARPRDDDANSPSPTRTSEEWNGAMRSWSDVHPPGRGWNFVLWTDEKVESTFLSPETATALTMVNRDVYDCAVERRHYGLASDVLRLEILYAFGGVYSDVDYYCTGPLDVFHRRRRTRREIGGDGDGKRRNDRRRRRRIGFDFYCGASNAGCVEVNNGLIGCAEGHPLIRRMMDEIRTWWRSARTDGSNARCDSPPSSSSPPVPRSSSFLLASFLDEESASALRAAKRRPPSSSSPKVTAMDVIERTGPWLLTRTVGRAVARRYDCSARRPRPSSASKAAPREIRASGPEEERAGNASFPEARNEMTAQRGEADAHGTFDARKIAVLPSVYFHPFPNHLRTLLRSRRRGRDRAGGASGSGVVGDDGDGIFRDVVDSFAIEGQTKAVHLWSCSWQK